MLILEMAYIHTHAVLCLSGRQHHGQTHRFERSTLSGHASTSTLLGRITTESNPSFRSRSYPLMPQGSCVQPQARSHWDLLFTPTYNPYRKRCAPYRRNPPSLIRCLRDVGKERCGGVVVPPSNKRNDFKKDGSVRKCPHHLLLLFRA